MDGEPLEPCSQCGAPSARGQRYCLTCGARVAPDPLLAGLLARIGAPADPDVPAEPGPVAAMRPVGKRRWLNVPAAPRPRVWAALAVGFLGFGVLLGGAARRPSPAALASARAPLRVVLANAPSPAATEGAPASAEEAPAQEPESPASEPGATPAPASSAPAPAAAKQEPAEGSSNPAGGQGAASAPATKLPKIRRVFVVMLSDEPYASVFGPASSAHYLSQTLEHKGALLVRYDAVAHEQLANELALLSGQGPTPETASNCPTYADLAATGSGADGQVTGSGCVYPAATRTLVGQLAAKHLKARAYVEGIDEPSASAGACAHPVLGQSDPSSAGAPVAGSYATFRNPFVYFHSILDSPSCAVQDVGIGRLSADLALGGRAPSLLYISPDRCHDGEPTPCGSTSPGAMAPADAFLKQWIPRIEASKAYKEGGLIAITTDEAPSSGEFADSSSCCGQPLRYPNLAPPPPGGPTGHGGGTVGALLLSPFITHSSTSQEPYNHYSLLRTIEDVFGLGHLGYAALAGVKPFEPSLLATVKG
ncbi:MAG TPA: alkaline phosphatase family protein [Solirubrobacteraceae bacterium]